MISANPALSGKVELIEDIIESTAVRRTTDQMCGQIPGTQIPNPVFGYGRIDALAAVKKSLSLISSTSTSPDASNPLVIFPNPASQEIFISLNNNQNFEKIMVFDIQGKLIDNQKYDQTETLVKLLLENYRNGLYIIRAFSNGRSYSMKFLKK